MQDENLTPYVEGSLGRWYPVTKSGAARTFWTDDPHRKIVHKQFSAGTVTFEFTKNYKFTILNNENVWAKAVNRVVNDKWPVGEGGRRDDRAHQGGRRLALSQELRQNGSRSGPVLCLMAAIAIPARRPQRRRRGLSTWQTWGIILLAPYVLVFLVFVLYPVGYGLWLARHPESYGTLFDDPVFFALGRQHARLPAGRDQPQDAAGAVPLGLLRARAALDQVAVGDLHPAVGGAVDPDHPLDPLHAQSRVGRRSTR